MANSVWEIVGEEFFQQGFLDGVEGFVFDGDRRDKVELNRNQSFLPFYQQVCHPMFATLDKICQELLTNTTQLEINIKSWNKELDRSLDSGAQSEREAS
jgi:hypothetical protein